jgi:hypothetical protein
MSDVSEICPEIPKNGTFNALPKYDRFEALDEVTNADVELSLINREMDRSDFLSVSSVRDRNTAEHSGADCEKQL